jgi:hypothetical protein
MDRRERLGELADLGISTKQATGAAASAAMLIPGVGLPVAAAIELAPLAIEEVTHPRKLYEGLKHDIFSLFGHKSTDAPCSWNTIVFNRGMVSLFGQILKMFMADVEASRDPKAVALWNQGKMAMTRYPIANDSNHLFGYPMLPCANAAIHPGWRCGPETVKASTQFRDSVNGLVTRLTALHRLGAGAEQAKSTAFAVLDAYGHGFRVALGPGGRNCGHSSELPQIRAAFSVAGIGLQRAAGLLNQARLSAGRTPPAKVAVKAVATAATDQAKKAAAAKVAAAAIAKLRTEAAAAIAKAKRLEGAAAQANASAQAKAAYAQAYQQARALIGQTQQAQTAYVPVPAAPAVKGNVGMKTVGWLAIGAGALEILKRLA